jgi:hypothetical protein
MSDERPEEIVIEGANDPGPTAEELLGFGRVDIDALESPPKEESTPPTKVDPKTVKLDGDDFPEEFRGKSLADVLEHTRRLESALRISEQGRVAAQHQPPPAASAPVPVADEPDLNREELAQLLQTDAVAGVQALIDRAMTRAEKHLERRLGGITAGAASTAEAHARQLYPMEFELFGSQIKRFVELMPDKSPLSSVDGWDNAIAYIRGLRGNIEQYMEAVSKKNGKDTTIPPGPTREAAVAGPVLRSQRAPVGGPSARITDPTEREVMIELNFNPDDPKSVREWNYWKGQK